VDEVLKTFYEMTERRRSVREYSGRAIEPEKMERLLATLNRAQSAANRQPWHFIVVEGEAKVRLDPVFTKEGFKAAPVAIVACAEPEGAWVRKADNVNYAWVDVTIAVTEMVTAATAEGLGTCWIAALDPVEVSRILGIPDGIEVVGIITLGYPAGELTKQDKPRKPLDGIVHHGKW